MSPTALRTASAFDPLLDDPFEREAPLLELRDLLLDFGLAFAFVLVFEAFDFGDDFEAFDFVAGFADFEVDVLFDFGVDFDFGFDLDFELGVDLLLV
jgi:hypothetical protein